jgi:putative FmdB family regulatory protein
MPTYEYQCSACGHRFEEFQSITAKPIRKCPSCGKLKVDRLIGTGAGMIFKGSGFYITDYRSESYKSAAKADGGSGSSSGGGDAGKSGGTTSGTAAAAPAPAASSPAPSAPAPSTPAPSKPDGGKGKKKAS